MNEMATKRHRAAKPQPNGIPLLEKEGWREAPGWSVRPKRFAGLTTPSAPSLRSARLLLRLRPIGLALRALLAEEGNLLTWDRTAILLVPIFTFKTYKYAH